MGLHLPNRIQIKLGHIFDPIDALFRTVDTFGLHPLEWMQRWICFITWKKSITLPRPSHELGRVEVPQDHPSAIQG